MAGAGSSGWWSWPAPRTGAGWKSGASVPIWRFGSSTTARSPSGWKCPDREPCDSMTHDTRRTRANAHVARFLRVGVLNFFSLELVKKAPYRYTDRFLHPGGRYEQQSSRATVRNQGAHLQGPGTGLPDVRRDQRPPA